MLWCARACDTPLPRPCPAAELGGQRSERPHAPPWPRRVLVVGGAAPSSCDALSSLARSQVAARLFSDPHSFAYLAARPRPVTGVAPASPHSGRSSPRVPVDAGAWGVGAAPGGPFAVVPLRPATSSPVPKFSLFSETVDLWQRTVRGRRALCPSASPARVDTSARSQAGDTCPRREVRGARRSLLPKASRREHHETREPVPAPVRRGGGSQDLNPEAACDLRAVGPNASVTRHFAVAPSPTLRPGLCALLR